MIGDALRERIKSDGADWEEFFDGLDDDAFDQVIRHRVQRRRTCG